MEGKTYKHEDRTVLSGCIVSLQFYPRTASVRLAVNAGGIRVYPEVTFYSLRMLEGFKVRENVIVEGHMQLRVETGPDGKNVFTNVIVADSIRHRYRAVNEFLDIDETRNVNGGIPDDQNYSFMLGEVSHVYIPPKGKGNVAVLTVRFKRGDGHDTTAEVSCFQRQARIAVGLGKGDTVALCGTVRVSERPDASGRTPQNIVCKDIIVLEKAEGAAAAAAGRGKGSNGEEKPGPEKEPQAEEKASEEPFAEKAAEEEAQAQDVPAAGEAPDEDAAGQGSEAPEDEGVPDAGWEAEAPEDPEEEEAEEKAPEPDDGDEGEDELDLGFLL